MRLRNLRSGREVGLRAVCRRRAVCTWMGHAREVAREHHMSVPAEHAARAIAGESISAGGERTARPAAQSVHAEPCSTAQDQRGRMGKSRFAIQKKGCGPVR